MNPSTPQCPNCHAALQPNDVFCPMCGAAVPPAQPQEPVTAQNFEPAPPVPPYPVAQPPRPAAAPPDVTVAEAPMPPPAPAAQPTQTGYQPWQPQAPAGPGVVPPMPGAPAAGITVPPPVPPTPGTPPASFGPPLSGGYPPAYSGYPQPAPPKKRNRALIGILCAVFVLLVAGGVSLFMLYGPPAEARREAEVQAEYQALMEVICKSDTPDALAARGGDLDDFSGKHPNVVDADLEELVAACDEYEYGDRDDKDTFESMKLTLERLENSDISPVADCAAKLLVGVTEEYDAFVERVAAEEAAAAAAAAENEEDDGPEIMGPPASAPFPEPVPYELVTDFAVVDDDFYHYEFLNTSDLTIEYIETWIFCYDENGNPIDGDPIDDGLANVEWTIDYPALDAGALYTLADYEATGFYKFSRCEGTVYALPFISFVKFSDGTYWGITDYTEDDDTYIADGDDVMAQMYGMREIADEYVAMTIGAPNDD